MLYRTVIIVVPRSNEHFHSLNYFFCLYCVQVWDIRTKANVHTLTGHTNTVATVKCQSAEPQIITGSVYFFCLSCYVLSPHTTHPCPVMTITMSMPQEAMTPPSGSGISLPGRREPR